LAAPVVASCYAVVSASEDYGVTLETQLEVFETLALICVCILGLLITAPGYADNTWEF
jgi:hypothetical protein